MTVLPVSFKGQFPSLQLSKGVYVYFGWSGLERITGFSQFLVMLRWKHISSASCHVVIVHKVQGSVISRVFAGIFSNLEGLSEMSTCGLTRSLQVVHHVGSYCVTSCRGLVVLVHHVCSCGGAGPEGADELCKQGSGGEEHSRNGWIPERLPDHLIQILFGQIVR